MQTTKFAASFAAFILLLTATAAGADGRSHAPIYTGGYANGIWERGKSRFRPVKKTQGRRAAQSSAASRRSAVVYKGAHPGFSRGHSSGADYLGELIGQGGNTRWSSHKMPLSVYVTPSPYGGLIASAFDEWQRASGGRISWTRASSPSSADIVVRWSGSAGPRGGGHEAGLTNTITSVDDYGHEYIERADINISTRAGRRGVSRDEIKKTALHEIGHALGLNGHSGRDSDIMYAAISPKQTAYLNGRDKATINRLYGN